MGERNFPRLLEAEILDDDLELSLSELCRSCALTAERVIEFVEEGIVEPVGREPARWRFRAVSVRRVRCAQRLEADLGVNIAGAALVLDLLDELEAVRARLRQLDE